ncbi:MAG: LysM peptidoglycan-binding domain-containing protein, partial [Taibaiella sp.]|nr:LysM peptidoglycan-binding domain-containing protein [Taibaiella sp.]
RRYHVPPAMLADENNINFQSALNPGQLLFIPFGPYNQAKETGDDRFDVRPLRYQVRKYDNLFRLAHLAGVQQRVLQRWNGMPDN